MREGGLVPVGDREFPKRGLALQKLISTILPTILLACALFAVPAGAQTGAVPNAAPAANSDVLTPDQAKRALDTLVDDNKRAQMIDTLRAIANASPQAQAAPPAPEPKPASP